MRWFVEVSRVGDDGSDEKYCVEAKQWQAALQEARKLRGDSGPLSKFSIELLDDGYRAVDPKQKLCYVVAKAPPGTELSREGRGGAPAEAAGRNGQAPSLSPYSPSASPPPAAVGSMTPSLAPAARPSVGAPAASASVSSGRAVHAEPYAGVPSSALSPHAPPSAVHASASPPRAEASAKLPAVKATQEGAPSSDTIPAAPAVPQGLGLPLPQSMTQPSAALELPPPATVLRRRQEEPTADSPITYREVAYVVEPGATRGAIEALLWSSFRDLSRELAARPGQKFVQLAVFDHRFERRPERPPLGTLAWKDWRGNPVLSFPFFDGSAHVRPSGTPPSIVPAEAVTITSSAAPAASGALGAGAAPVGDPSAAPPALATESVPPPSAGASIKPSLVPPRPAAAEPAAVLPEEPPVLVSPAPEAPALVSSAPAQPLEPPTSSATPAALEPHAARVAPPSTPEGQPAPAHRGEAPTSAPSLPAAREQLSSQPSATRSSRPRMAAVRRRAGEDLIGELFETMHDLHFMSGVADGAEFVLSAIDSVVPSAGMLVHVFDINARQFVVVRAKGPTSTNVLLHRTPDSDAFFGAIMRRPGSIAIHDTQKDTRVLGARWHALGVEPTHALCGPVRQGGRYLGLVEVVNPLGGAPFHQTEQNAIDYVCEQFAQFLVNRPIVLDAEVILKR
jgi:hypothetical protein